MREAGSPQSLLLGAFLAPQAAVDIFERKIEMIRNVSALLYVVALIAVVVSLDLLFFRNRFWERLMVNVGVVLVFAAFYLRFLKSP
jgi:hypothetical protein